LVYRSRSQKIAEVSRLPTLELASAWDTEGIFNLFLDLRIKGSRLNSGEHEAKVFENSVQWLLRISQNKSQSSLKLFGKHSKYIQFTILQYSRVSGSLSAIILQNMFEY
jgi:hypothetical protein